MHDTEQGQPEVDADEIEIDDEDFSPVDLGAAVTARLIRGEGRDEIAVGLAISRDEVDARIADAVDRDTAVRLAERRWVVRERVADLTRQASAAYVPSEEGARLGLLLSLARFELELIGLADEIRED